MTEKEIVEEVSLDLVRSILGKNDPNLIHQFTDPNVRDDDVTASVIWMNGNPRFPHINRFTGAVAIYTNLKVYEYAFSKMSFLENAYQINQNSLIMSHGPPALIIKPANAGKSTPFVYRFQDITEGMKYTALVCLNSSDNPLENTSKRSNGELEILRNFETYYDVLSEVYEFDKHTKSGDILYLEKWFDLQDANEIVEEYVNMYNYYVRNIPSTLKRSVRGKVSALYKNTDLKLLLMKSDILPIKFIPMRWIRYKKEPGDVTILNSRQALRTAANHSNTVVSYLQIAAEPINNDWKNSFYYYNLITSYKTGKFGDWIKPGVRKFIRENSAEYNYRIKTNTLDIFKNHKWSPTQLQYLGIDSKEFSNISN